MRKLLITGGLGFIGSNIVECLIGKKFKIFIIDNLSNSSKKTFNYLKKNNNKIYFEKLDLRNYDHLKSFLKNKSFSDVIHLAGLKSVEDSQKEPLKYIENNILGSANLINLLRKSKKKINFIFSSSSTVYSEKNKIPFDENSLLDYKNNYGMTKLMVEKLLLKSTDHYKNFYFVSLRYFNPVGSNCENILGDFGSKSQKNLFPEISKSIFYNKKLKVHGGTYNTKDGTCIRDYIHVVDVANAHLQALNQIYYLKKNKIFFLNIGSGKGYSVIEIIKTYENVNNVKVNFKLGEAREGDLPISISSTKLCNKYLKWSPKKNLTDMCSDHHKFFFKKVLIK